MVFIIDDVVRSLVDHGLATARDRKSRTANAQKAFRDEVLQAFAGMYPIATDWPVDINQRLRSVFPQLQAATEKLRPFIHRRHRKDFDRAWDIYRVGMNGRPTIDAQVYHQYIGFSGQPDPRKMFRENVKRLLSFASEA
jgi:hypothetical protein